MSGPLLQNKDRLPCLSPAIAKKEALCWTASVGSGGTTFHTKEYDCSVWHSDTEGCPLRGAPRRKGPCRRYGLWGKLSWPHRMLADVGGRRPGLTDMVFDNMVPEPLWAARCLTGLWWRKMLGRCDGKPKVRVTRHITQSRARQGHLPRRMRACVKIWSWGATGTGRHRASGHGTPGDHATSTDHCKAFQTH